MMPGNQSCWLTACGPKVCAPGSTWRIQPTWMAGWPFSETCYPSKIRPIWSQNFFCDYGYNIEIGSNFYSNHNLTIVDVCKVTIGDNVLIAPHVMISTGTHPIDPIERQKTEYGSPITIGNNVWIGGNVSVLPGVTIGDNCVIGAGSVVNRDIPANSVAVGNPCRVIRTIDARAC